MKDFELEEDEEEFEISNYSIKIVLNIHFCKIYLNFL